MPVSRRNFVYLSVGSGLFLVGYPLSRSLTESGPSQSGGDLKPTPSNTLGPFYKKGAPRKTKLFDGNDSGVPLLVAGKVISTNGKALPDATIEVFHSDHYGKYDMAGFRYRGEIPVGDHGEYDFETIVPGQYGGRAQHIHYVISAPGHRRLITQLYFENDPKFGGNPDKNYVRDSLVWHRELIRPVTVVSRNRLNYSSVLFDLCLERA